MASSLGVKGASSRAREVGGCNWGLLLEDGETPSLIYFLLIGLLAGWLAGRIMAGRSLDPARSLVVGVVGAILGGFLFQVVGLAATGLIGSLIGATVGAIVLLFLLQKFGKRPQSFTGDNRYGSCSRRPRSSLSPHNGRLLRVRAKG